MQANTGTKLSSLSAYLYCYLLGEFQARQRDDEDCKEAQIQDVGGIGMWGGEGKHGSNGIGENRAVRKKRAVDVDRKTEHIQHLALMPQEELAKCRHFVFAFFDRQKQRQVLRRVDLSDKRRCDVATGTAVCGKTMRVLDQFSACTTFEYIILGCVAKSRHGEKRHEGEDRAGLGSRKRQGEKARAEDIIDRESNCNEEAKAFLFGFAVSVQCYGEAAQAQGRLQDVAIAVVVHGGGAAAAQLSWKSRSGIRSRVPVHLCGDSGAWVSKLREESKLRGNTA